MTLSGAWQAGAREGIIEGVSMRIVVVDEGDLCCFWDWETRSGRKAWRRVKGARRWLFRVSDQADGGSVINGEMGYVEGGGGRRIRAVRCRMCGWWAEEWECGVSRWWVSFWIVSCVEEGFSGIHVS